MIRNITIENRNTSGELADVVNIVLENEDGTYGVKRRSDGSIIVAANTPVDHPNLGIYTKDIDIYPNVVYEACWKILYNVGDEVKYIHQEYGPFQEGARATAEFRGTFIQGSVGTLILRVRDIFGSYRPIENCNVAILDLAGNEIATYPADIIETGFYICDWVVPPFQNPGKYRALWTYDVDGEHKSELQEFVVTIDATKEGQTYSVLMAFRIGLEKFIGEVQAIPIEFEQSRPSHDNKTYSFTFPRWNQYAGIRVYRNGTQVVDGFEVDYLNGKVIFDKPNLDADIINVDYNFRWFSDQDMDQYIFFGLQKVNVYPPQTIKTLLNVPDLYVPCILKSAAADALRRFTFALGFPQNRALFGGKEITDSWRQSLDAGIKDYNEDAKQFLDNKKNFPYGGLTRSIIGQQYTMPGGRARMFRMMFGNGFL